MNNVIVLLIDSVFSDCLGNQKTQISATPFIDSLKENAIFMPNVFSYGPYTDAATKALYCGNRTLDNYGYFFGLNSSEYNHFRLFKENGYETYGLYYPYYLLGSEIEKYIDHSIYTGGFKYISVWGGKFEYYASEKCKRDLSNQEYLLLEKCLDLVFDCWLTFYHNLDFQLGSDSIVRNLFNKTLHGLGHSCLIREHQDYLENRRAYLDRVLEQGLNHPLANINEFDYGRNEDITFVKKVYKNNKRFFSKAARVNFIKNLINNPINFRRSIKKLCLYIKNHDRTELRYFGNYVMLMFSIRMMIKRSQRPQWQDVASLNKQIEVIFQELDKRPSANNAPFFASIHALEPHHNISIFSFDSYNSELVQNELAYLSPLIEDCGRDFSGNLLYQLSLRYVDYYVKKLFSELENRRMLTNTTVMLVSDHGTSYFFNPIRSRVVNTFHRENYHIPMLIWGKNIAKNQIGTNENVFCSDDIFPTLCDIVGIDIPKCFTGNSMLKNTYGREYIITEYMGPGVPDMINREIWISIRNKNFVIAYKNRINKPLDIENPVIIYNLQRDPEENKNWKNMIGIKDNEITYLVQKIEERYKCLQKDSEAYLKRLMDITVSNRLIFR